MSYRLEFEIEGLPRMSNASGRSRGHWVMNRETQKWKELAAHTARAKGLPPRPLKRALLTLTRFSSSEPDGDGVVAGFKPIIDGLVVAGVLEDDKWSNTCGLAHYRWEKVKPKQGFLRVVVEEVAP